MRQQLGAALREACYKTTYGADYSVTLPLLYGKSSIGTGPCTRHAHSGQDTAKEPCLISYHVICQKINVKRTQTIQGYRREVG